MGMLKSVAKAALKQTTKDVAKQAVKDVAKGAKNALKKVAKDTVKGTLKNYVEADDVRQNSLDMTYPELLDALKDKNISETQRAGYIAAWKDKHKQGG